MKKIKDIAAEMNLSSTTVSNALNGKGRMSAEVRLEIQRRAAELGYRPSRRTRKRKAQNIIVIAEDLLFFGSNLVLEGIRGEAMENHFTLPVYNLGIRGESSDRFEPDTKLIVQAVNALINEVETAIDCIIYVAQYPRKITDFLNTVSIPVISAFCIRESGYPYICYDDRQGAYLATASLIEKDCRTIAMISGPINSNGMIMRMQGYQNALIDHGLSFDPRLVKVGNWRVSGGYQETKALLEEGHGVDAIFSQNDEMARGAIQAIAEASLHIPEDISIIGFDNSVLASHIPPGLTTITPAYEEIGRTAFRLAMEALSGRSVADRQIIIPCTLTVRDTMRK